MQFASLDARSNRITFARITASQPLDPIPSAVRTIENYISIVCIGNNGQSVRCANVLVVGHNKYASPTTIRVLLPETWEAMCIVQLKNNNVRTTMRLRVRRGISGAHVNEFHWRVFHILPDAPALEERVRFSGKILQSRMDEVLVRCLIDDFYPIIPDRNFAQLCKNKKS